LFFTCILRPHPLPILPPAISFWSPALTCNANRQRWEDNFLCGSVFLLEQELPPFHMRILLPRIFPLSSCSRQCVNRLEELLFLFLNLVFEVFAVPSFFLWFLVMCFAYLPLRQSSSLEDLISLCLIWFLPAPPSSPQVPITSPP